MKSLDPRVKRLPEIASEAQQDPKISLAQFGTFEVFVQPNPKKPFQHEGAVHAPNIEMAYVLAKETFTRRFTCSSMYVVETSNVYVSPLTEGSQSVYDLVNESKDTTTTKEQYEVYHLAKRGKQHIHAGAVVATSPEGALWEAKNRFNTGTAVFNVWAIRTSEIRFTKPDDDDFWSTLPEKKFRDAADYKGGEKLKTFLDSTK